MPRRIQMSRQHPWRVENPDAVIVARPSKWGNPYGVSGETDRAGAVALFEDMLRRAPVGGDGRTIQQEIRAELPGRDLACWCPLPAPGEPDICHAAVLLEIANSDLKETA